MAAALLLQAAVALRAPHLGGAGGSQSGHMLSGVPIRGAGVVPYVNLPGRGVHFLLQTVTNGTRTGKMCDFGGRRESPAKMEPAL